MISFHDLEFNKVSVMDSSETTIDYITYLKKVSDSKDLAIIVSAMAPCPWTYYEISEVLNKRNIRTLAFKRWIQFYSSKESFKQVNKIKQLLDKLALESDEKQKNNMRKYFSNSCNYEIDFWNMAYSHEQ